MDNTEYTKLFGNKCLNEVINDYILGKYSFRELKLYLDWNGFELKDIDFNNIYAEKLKQAIKRRST